MALENPPLFSNGWLTKFQMRQAFRSFIAHGVSGVRSKIAQHPMDRVYNFDELGLFYRMAPDKSIAAQQILGAEKDKTRMTIGLMVNMVELDWDMIFLSHAKNPRCFQKNMELSLGFFTSTTNQPG
jgi:hypothetical protein